MKTSIFIKTCLKDLEWLSYSLRSIRKFCKGFQEVVIVADDDCKGVIEPMLSGERLLLCPVHHNGYIQQQIIKCNAWVYVNNPDAILYVDSDVIFFREASPQDFMADGKPLLLKTPYGNLGGAEAWKPITENFVGFRVSHEYMRRMPLLFLTRTVREFERQYAQKIMLLNRMTTRDFSEFNAIGAFAAAYHPDLYRIIDTETEPAAIPQPVAKQFWSWGGISSEIKTEMESFLQ